MYFIQCIFGSGTDFVTRLAIHLLVVFVGATLFKRNPQAPSFQIGSGWKWARLLFK